MYFLYHSRLESVRGCPQSRLKSHCCVESVKCKMIWVRKMVWRQKCFRCVGCYQCCSICLSVVLPCNAKQPANALRQTRPNKQLASKYHWEVQPSSQEEKKKIIFHKISQNCYVCDSTTAVVVVAVAGSPCRSCMGMSARKGLLLPLILHGYWLLPLNRKVLLNKMYNYSVLCRSYTTELMTRICLIWNIEFLYSRLFLS